MKHWMGRGLLLAALLALLTIPAWAYEIPTDFSERSLEDAVAELMEANNTWAYGITEDEVRAAFSLIRREWLAGDN